MSFQFHVGQRVVCIDTRPNKRGLFPRYWVTAIPRLRGVYTIRDIFDASPYGYNEPALLLAEVVNPARDFITPEGRQVHVEQFWLASRFRPVRTTNIDVFLKLLEPVPTRQRVEEEAADLADEPVRFVMSVPPGVLFVGWQSEPADAPPEAPRKPHSGFRWFRRP